MKNVEIFTMKFLSFLQNQKGHIVLSIFLNMALWLLYAGFIKFRITNWLSICNKFNVPFDFASFMSALGHEFSIALLGLLSIVGISFWRNSKSFFFMTLLYVATTMTIVVLAPSFSILYFVKLISTVLFLWVLVFKEVFAVYENQQGLKLFFFFLGVLIYSAILYCLGIL
jgi:hypothetical protein